MRQGPSRPEADVAALVAAARQGSPRAVARLISLVENADPSRRGVRELMAALTASNTPSNSASNFRPGQARTVGLTGAPGVGKSTVTSAMVGALRAAGRRVGVLAVDPSSPFSGGALLGDRVRMQEHATDPGVFIRSMATRGQLGGLAAATSAALRVLEAAGCDDVLIETVGVGQSEVEVAGLADTTVVLLAPGMGDGIQAAKAGILEVGDVFVVNKADRDGAQATVRDLRHMIALGQREAGAWRPPVLSTVASAGQGIEELVEALDRHHEWAQDGGELHQRRQRRAAAEVEAVALAALRRRIAGLRDGELLAKLAREVAEGRLDPYTAADELVADLAASQRSPVPASAAATTSPHSG